MVWPIYLLFNFTSFSPWHSLQKLIVVGQSYQLLPIELTTCLQLIQRAVTLTTSIVTTITL